MLLEVGAEVCFPGIIWISLMMSSLEVVVVGFVCLVVDMLVFIELIGAGFGSGFCEVFTLAFGVRFELVVFSFEDGVVEGF